MNSRLALAEHTAAPGLASRPSNFHTTLIPAVHPLKKTHFAKYPVALTLLSSGLAYPQESWKPWVEIGYDFAGCSPGDCIPEESEWNTIAGFISEIGLWASVEALNNYCCFAGTILEYSLPTDWISLEQSGMPASVRLRARDFGITPGGQLYRNFRVDCGQAQDAPPGGGAPWGGWYDDWSNFYACGCPATVQMGPKEWTFTLGAPSGEDLPNWTGWEYNCYNYAVNSKSAKFAQPLTPGEPRPAITCAEIGYQAELDGLRPASPAKPVPGEPVPSCDGLEPLVALFVDEGRDAHWVRQNADGSWSHKPGNRPATSYAGIPHEDGYCTWSTLWGIIPVQRCYEFCGYYCVRCVGVELDESPTYSDGSYVPYFASNQTGVVCRRLDTSGLEPAQVELGDLAVFLDAWGDAGSPEDIPADFWASAQFRIEVTPATAPPFSLFIGHSGVAAYSDTGQFTITYLAQADKLRDLVYSKFSTLADRTHISATNGGFQQISYSPGSKYSGLMYLLCGSKSGQVIGYEAWGAELYCPLDEYTLNVAAQAGSALYPNSFGFLDASGTGYAAVQVPSGLAELVGLEFQHFFVTLAPESELQLVHASIPELLRITD